MLRDAGVRTKLLAVLAIPTVLLVVVTFILVGGQVAAAGRAGQVERLTHVASQVNKVVHGLQDERDASLTFLQDGGQENSLRLLTGRREYVDRQLAKLDREVEASGSRDMSANIVNAVERIQGAHAELRGARASIDAGRYYATETDTFYTRVIKTDLQLPRVIAQLGAEELAQHLLANEGISGAIEYSSHERDLRKVAELSGSLTEVGFAQASALVTQQGEALQDFKEGSDPADAIALENALAEVDNFGLDQIRRGSTDLLVGTDPQPEKAEAWVNAANSRIQPMVEAERDLVRGIQHDASAVKASENRKSYLLGGAALFGLLLAGLLAIGLAQRIVRPLRRLTIAAGEIGAELPRMVERMQTPGEGPGVEVEPIPVESRDEVGQLAEAFNSVNDVTVQVAKEQAALRASIAEMFVNVARRNQVLLGRQLSQLDQMESHEEDPDVLDRLFKLDHLATRMRRNAESLLVLAGIDSTRRYRHALPLSDVIRAAVSEIETFERIDLAMSEDHEVPGRYVLPIAHLLAELLENATHFSNPGTRVVVASSLTGHTVNVTITDYGLGMSDEELAEAQDKIDHPPVADIVASQRLGFYVVGRIAKRLGTEVTLRRGRSAGTVATVALPFDVFAGLAVDQPEGAPGQPVEPVESRDAVESHHAVRPHDEVRWHDAVRAAQDAAPQDETGDASEPAAAETAAPPSRRGLLPNRRRRSEPAQPAESVPVTEPVEVEPVAVGETAAVGVEPAQVEPVEVEPVVAVEPAQVEPVELEPLDLEAPEVEAPEVAVEPVEVAPAEAEVAEAEVEEPLPAYLFAPAIDILPGRPPAGGLPRPAGTDSAGTDSPVYRLAPAASPSSLAPAPVAEPVEVAEAPAVPVLDAPQAAPEPAVASAPVALAPAAPAPSLAPVPPLPTRALVRPQGLVSAPGQPLPGRSAHATVPTGPPAQARAGSSAPFGSEPPRRGDLADEARNAQLQSQALSELRGLYEPAFAPAEEPVEQARPDGLARRTPKPVQATDPAEASPGEAAPAAARQRTAADVRGMLSGFRAGIERGRTTPTTGGAPAPSADNEATS